MGADKDEGEIEDTLRPEVERIASALVAVASDDDGEGLAALSQAVDKAARTARRLRRSGPRSNSEMWDVPVQATIAETIGGNLKRARNGARWSQERLAKAMATAGQPWKRITCAEVEAADRRVSFDELASLAALFGLPIVSFLLPEDHVGVELPVLSRVLHPQDFRELLLGREGRVGDGGVAWAPAFEALPPESDTEDRPAADYWRGQHRPHGW